MKSKSHIDKLNEDIIRTERKMFISVLSFVFFSLIYLLITL